MTRDLRAPLTRWAGRGAVVVAIVAAVGLAVTVLVARAALRDASVATVRGEGAALLLRIHDPRVGKEGPPTHAELQRILDELAPEGLRAVSMRRPDHTLTVGTPTIATDGLAPGAIVIARGRAALVGALPPPPPGLLLDGPPRRAPPTRPPAPLSGAGDDDEPPDVAAPWNPNPTVAIEFAPEVLPKLEAAVDRTVLVGSLAVVVLLAFAATLSVRAVRQDRDEREAEQQRRFVALGQMSAVMAHELRNPLTSLKGNAQLLAEATAEGTREHAKAELVVHEAERLERLTRDLLAFVRDGPLDVAPVSPRDLLAESLEAVAARDRVDVDASEAPAEITVDGGRMAAAIRNLVDNAIQATPGDARVSLRVHARGGEVVIDVRDRGPGVAPADTERIFEPFFTTRLHGTGLGLAVARRATEQHGGTLRVEAPPGGGALFRIILPGTELPR